MEYKSLAKTKNYISPMAVMIFGMNNATDSDLLLLKVLLIFVPMVFICLLALVIKQVGKDNKTPL